jgi:AbrB family looped-hinge helix DNA binding protein
MDTVTISPKYQVVIPKAIREKLNLSPGMKAHVLAYGDRIEFLPVRDAADLRGMLRGVDTSFERDREDRA